MRDSIPHIHWHEGLFLEPQHLQMLQREVRLQAAWNRWIMSPYPYGVIEAALDTEALTQFKVKFQKLHVILKNGLHVCVDTDPDRSNATLPELDISDVFHRDRKPLTIALAVPRWQPSYANQLEGDNYRANRLFRVQSIEVRDENTGNDPRTIEIRKLNARLIVKGTEDETDLEILPLLSILPGASDDQQAFAVADSRFVPATYVLSGSQVLLRMTQTVQTYLVSRRDQLREAVQALGKINPIQPVGGEIFLKTIRLKSYELYAARLEQLLRRPMVTPAEIFLEMRSLVAELASLEVTSQESIRAWQVQPYDHDNPFLCFDELSKVLRLLMPGQGPTFRKVDFRRTAKFQMAQLDDSYFNEGSEFYVAVTSPTAPLERVKKLVEEPSLFVVTAAAEFDQYSKPFGMPLVHEAAPVTAPSNQHFFRIIRSGQQMQRWKRVRENEGKLAAYWPKFDQSDLSLSLYLTISNLK